MLTILYIQRPFIKLIVVRVKYNVGGRVTYPRNFKPNIQFCWGYIPSHSEVT